LAELVVVAAILLALAGLVASGVLGAVDFARQTACASNLRQVGLAIRFYLDEHEGWFFPLYEDVSGGRRWYFGFEPAGSPALGEGNRILDRTRGPLYPYLRTTETVEVCPAMPCGGPYKAKFMGLGWNYGINYYLCYHPTMHPTYKGRGNYFWIRPQDVSRTAILADAAQVNTFQAPASPTNPMVEDWYYLQPRKRYVHFRHGGLANVLFADGHVEAVGPAEGSFDPRLPQARIGYFDDRDVLFEPRAGR
jgi:prepilin-type processing-associated H-X9-DG protein